MGVKFSVVWTLKSEKTARLLCVDDENFCETPEEAKEAGRKLLPKLKTTELMPVEVTSLTDEKLEELLIGNKPIEAYGPEGDLIDFLRLVA